MLHTSRNRQKAGDQRSYSKGCISQTIKPEWKRTFGTFLSSGREPMTRLRRSSWGSEGICPVRRGSCGPRSDSASQQSAENRKRTVFFHCFTANYNPSLVPLSPGNVHGRHKKDWSFWCTGHPRCGCSFLTNNPTAAFSRILLTTEYLHH